MGLLCTTFLYVQMNFAYLQENQSNWETILLNIYIVQYVCIISLIDTLLHDWAIYKISTFCTSVAWQIIEVILQQAISGNPVSTSFLDSLLSKPLLMLWVLKTSQ